MLAAGVCATLMLVGVSGMDKMERWRNESWPSTEDWDKEVKVWKLKGEPTLALAGASIALICALCMVVATFVILYLWDRRSIEIRKIFIDTRIRAFVEREVAEEEGEQTGSLLEGTSMESSCIPKTTRTELKVFEEERKTFETNKEKAKASMESKEKAKPSKDKDKSSGGSTPSESAKEFKF